MELNLIKEQKAHDYIQVQDLFTTDVEAAVDSAFKAGWDARQQLLQQTDCYTALELLQQMYNESTELAKQGFESWQELQMNSDTENALLRVMRLIKKRQANAA